MDSMEDTNGERRKCRRYGIDLDLRWKLIRRRRLLESGVGHTVDLSSSGILFNGDRLLPIGLDVELSISWPVLLSNAVPMQLIVYGQVVRSTQDCTAVVMVQHEFRTAGMSAKERGLPNGMAHKASAVFANSKGLTAFGESR